MTGRDDASTDAAHALVAAGDGGRWTLSGSISTANAGAIVARAETLALPATGVVDCSALTHVDSAAVALLLAFARRARAGGVTLTFLRVPAALASLARLYGVDEILAL